ncbi:phage tail tape measure protein [Methylocystis rosea]|uniref:Phage tail tape measure protein n=1 Tax=Methylocystis rosea TaxID=173366 RepID=A0A3G8M4E6_9HYPH|nr:phage tail tape measure protein [Methylocystis rosea]AZG75982.1 phage tail tape measure protein [Methylocystis rosea]
MVKTLKSELVLGAKDQTGSTFSQIAAKMRSVGDTAAQVSRRMDGVSSRMSSVGRLNLQRLEAHAAIAQRMSSGWGAPIAAAAVSSKVAAINQKMAGIRSGLSDFTAAAAPGTAGMMLGMGGAAVGGLAVGGAAAYGLRQAVSFDKAFADVKKKVELPAGESWDTVERMINSVARRFGIAREEMAALTAQAGQSGVAFKDLAGFMELTAKASAAWDMPAQEASEKLAKIQAQTQWTIPQLKEWADQVNELGDKSAAAERDIVEMFGRSAAAAKAAGVPFATTQAILTSLSGVGMQPEVSSRFLNSLTGTLATASAPKKGLDPYKALGLNASAVASGMKTDATHTIIQFLERLGKSKNRVAIAQALLGKEWYDEGLRSGQALPEIVKNLKLINSGSWQGSLDRNMVTTLETTESHLKRFGILTSEIGDRLSRWALPSINEGIERTLKSFDKMQTKGVLPVLGENASSAWSHFLANSRPQLSLSMGGDVPESVARAPRPLWSQFMANSRPQLSMPLGSDIPESAALPRKPLDLSGMRAIPAGPAKFGFGPAGFGANWGALAAGLNPHAQIEAKAKLEGSAQISNKLEIGLAPGFALVRSDSTVRADGALRGDVGVTMPHE